MDTSNLIYNELVKHTDILTSIGSMVALSVIVCFGFLTAYILLKWRNNK